MLGRSGQDEAGVVEYGNGLRRRVWEVQLPDIKMDALTSCDVEDVHNFYRSNVCVEFLHGHRLESWAPCSVRKRKMRLDEEIGENT